MLLWEGIQKPIDRWLKPDTLAIVRIFFKKFFIIHGLKPFLTREYATDLFFEGDEHEGSLTLDNNLLIGFVFRRDFKAHVAEILRVFESQIDTVGFRGQV